jgi:hypothetical protein
VRKVCFEHLTKVLQHSLDGDRALGDLDIDLENVAVRTLQFDVGHLKIHESITKLPQNDKHDENGLCGRRNWEIAAPSK